MEALTISAANLDTIEKNLGSVARELTGVITNVNDVNSQVTKVETQVNSLNNEVQNLVKEIRETTIITNARQSIMYNNSVIEKKFGYFDVVRRTTESLIDAVHNSSVSVTALTNLNQDLILHNPNYWLSNALAAFVSWILDDKNNCQKELNNALKKNESKTSLFFCLVNDRLGRTNTAINWLNKYLSIQNPANLDDDFVTVLDLVATGAFGDEAKNTVLNKIDVWFQRLNGDTSIQDDQLRLWVDFINDIKDTSITLPYIEPVSTDYIKIKKNLATTSIYYNLLNKFENITKNNCNVVSKDEILNKLIYEYEDVENGYQKDNLLNNLIIQCNGDRAEAERLFNKQYSVFKDNNDLLNLFSNIIINRNAYNVSDETQKIALGFMKKYIINAIEFVERDLSNDPIRININGFVTTTIDGRNREQILKELSNYVDSLFTDNDNATIIPLIIINILGVVGLFITLNNLIFIIVLVILLIGANGFLFYKMNKTAKLRNESKKNIYDSILLSLDRVLAEMIDCKNMQDDDGVKREELFVFLNNVKPDNYIKSNNERNIDLGV